MSRILNVAWIFFIFSVCDAEMYEFRIDLDRLSGVPMSTLNNPITAGDVIHVKDGHFYAVGSDLLPGTADDQRIRFWGINLAPPLVFPGSSEEAERLASQLAKLGFNLVRLHGLDRSMEDQKRTLLSTERHAPYPVLNKKNLIALDRLFNALQKFGLYVDLILKVGYKFDSSKDCYIGKNKKKYCVPDPGISTRRYPVAGQMPAKSKPLDLFNREMRYLQKAYFRAVLERYRDHPALALIEINNENSLIESFRESEGKFPPLYAEELDAMWNTWLVGKYGSTRSLRASWTDRVSPRINVELLRNGDFTRHDNGVPANWLLWQRKFDEGQHWGNWLVRDNDWLEVSIEQIPKKPWYFSFGQTGIPIQEGITYRIQFTARSDPPRRIGLSVFGHNKRKVAKAIPFRPSITVDRKGRRFTVCFNSSLSDENARLIFSPIARGEGKGKIWIDDVSFMSVPHWQLPDNEQLNKDQPGHPGNVTRPVDRRMSQCPGNLQRSRDYLEFLADVEKNYYKEMVKFIRNTLGVRRPITGTQANYGGLLSQKNMDDLMDYLDIHFYWDHPHFNRDKQTDWWIRNEPMVNHPARGIIAAIARGRVKGKPFTISEYSPNHTNQYSQEGYLLAAAYAALQDIDGIIVFTYNAAGGNFVPPSQPVQLRGWYDLAGEYRAQSLMHMAANIFRRADVSSAHSLIQVPVDSSSRIDPFIKGHSLRNIQAVLEDPNYIQDKNGRSFDVRVGLESRIELVHKVDRKLEEKSIGFPAVPGPSYISDTKELIWEHRANHRSFFTLDTPQTKAITGYIGRDFSLGGISIKGVGGSKQFGTVSVTSTDGKPIFDSRELLVTSVGSGRNRDTRFLPNRGGVRLCVVDASGSCAKPFWHVSAGPFFIESNPARIRIETSYNDFRVERLSPSGQPVGMVKTKLVDGGVEFMVGLDGDRTPWYRVVMERITH